MKYFLYSNLKSNQRNPFPLFIYKDYLTNPIRFGGGEIKIWFWELKLTSSYKVQFQSLTPTLFFRPNVWPDVLSWCQTTNKLFNWPISYKLLSIIFISFTHLPLWDKTKQNLRASAPYANEFNSHFIFPLYPLFLVLSLNKAWFIWSIWLITIGLMLCIVCIWSLGYSDELNTTWLNSVNKFGIDRCQQMIGWSC